MSPFRHDGRVALVTGSGQGVGAEIARTLAASGARVAVNDIVGRRAEAIAHGIRNSGGIAVAAPCDVTDPNAVGETCAAINAALGPVEILVNNAGIPVDGLELKNFVDTAPEDWEGLVRLNVFGVLLCTHAVLPGMISNGWGRVITVTSDAARVGERFQVVYGAAKAAALGFTRCLAKEVGRNGITVNCVSLGSIERGSGFPQRDPEQVARQIRRYAVPRLGTAADVANSVAWLASGEASWVTAQTVPVNGGYAAS